MLEIPGISVYKRNEGLRNEETIFVLNKDSVLYNRYDYRYRYEQKFCGSYHTKTLLQAKKIGGWDNNRWVHKYICPECSGIVILYNNDYADLQCDNCNCTFTRFGEKSKKH